MTISPRAVLIVAAVICVSFVSVPRARSQTGAPSNTLGLATGNSGKPINIEANNGIEWQQANRVYIARGHAKATRGTTSVTADTLYAYYRPTPAGAATHASASPNGTSPFDNGSSQIYRIEAEGHVVFATPTEKAYGDHAVYDVDQALLVMTGKHLKVVTPQDTITAHDSFEWYERKQIGVARGDALAVRNAPPKKSIRADILVAEITKRGNQPARISKVDAHGHVVLRSRDEVARADQAVYNLDTGIATLSGNVSLTQGKNELRGQYGVVDTIHNVARLLSAPPSATRTRPPPPVAGLLVPRSSGHPTNKKP